MFNFDILANVDFSVIGDIAHHVAHHATNALAGAADVVTGIACTVASFATDTAIATAHATGSVAHSAADTASAAASFVADTTSDAMHHNDVYESAFLKAGRAARLGNNPDLLNIFRTGDHDTDQQVIEILKTASASNLAQVKAAVYDLIMPFKSQYITFILW